MPLIEIAGMPRSGKTTTVERLKNHIDFIHHPENLDQIKPKSNPFEFNWNYLMNRIRTVHDAKTNSGLQIIERGPIDRYIWGITNYTFGRFTEKEAQIYFDILMPYPSYVDLAIILNCSPNDSLARMKNPTKNITGNIQFLRLLYASYSGLNTFPNTILLPEEANLDELEQLSLSAIQKVINN